ncbi:MAG TPA: DUF1428 domain-containing protein [Paracoccaceae bacterium]|nr:DUF1428 domain-containing protein [Paracoccaceae bacterium]
MYIQGFIVPVPADKKEEYRAVAQKFTDLMKPHGLVEMVEAWEADVPDGKLTDFRRAVNLVEGEKVVFSWVIWPDKATCDAAHEKMVHGMDMEIPFDGARMVWGGFEPLVVYGRD